MTDATLRCLESGRRVHAPSVAPAHREAFLAAVEAHCPYCGAELAPTDGRGMTANG